MIYSLIPSDINFHTTLMSEVIFGKFFATKKLVCCNHSYLKYALGTQLFSTQVPFEVLPEIYFNKFSETIVETAESYENLKIHFENH